MTSKCLIKNLQTIQNETIERQRISEAEAERFPTSKTIAENPKLATRGNPMVRWHQSRPTQLEHQQLVKIPSQTVEE